MGLLSSNITLDVKDTTDNGIIILQPSGSDTSVATINKTVTGTTRIKARQRVGYATVNASNTLKLSNVSFGKNCFFAILMRVQVPEAINTGVVKVLESTQTIAAGTDAGQPKFSAYITGRLNSDTSYRGRFTIKSERNDGSRLTTADSTGAIYKLYGTVPSSQIFYGDATNPRIGNDWHWWIMRRSTSTKNTNAWFLSQSAISFIDANRMAVGVGSICDDTSFRLRANLGARGTQTNVGTTSTEGLENFTSLDYVIGGSAADLDIARIVKIDASLDSLQCSAVLQGKWINDLGTLSVAWNSVTAFVTGTRVSDGGSRFIALQDSTNIVTSNTTYWRPVEDFMINMASLAEAGSKITVNTGSFTAGNTNSPMLEVDCGTVTNPTALTKTITSGKVIL